MPDKDLSFVQWRALMILMAEARQVQNSYLTNVRKVELKKPDRDVLENAGLIEVTREGKNGPLSMILSEKGWGWVKTELKAPVLPPRGGPTGATLHAIVEKLGQYLDRSGMAPADIFPAPAEPDIETRIRKAYSELAPQSGAAVMLAKLRAVLDDLPRHELDATLVRLSQAPDVDLLPESNQKMLTAAERAAAVRIGNQAKHLIAIDS